MADQLIAMKRLNASTAQPSATTGEHHQQIAPQTAEQLREGERLKFELEQQTKELEIQKMMLLQQLQERRSSISSPLSGGSDRDRRGSGGLVIGKPGAQLPRTNVSARTGSSSGGLVIGRIRSPDTRKGSPSQPPVSPGRRPTSPEKHSASPQQESPLRSGRTRSSDAQAQRTNVSARTGSSSGGLVIGRIHSPNTRQGSPSQPPVSPGRRPTSPENHSASPQQESPLGRGDSSSPPADARRQAMADQLIAMKRELMLKHSDRRKSAPTNMASAATALSPTTVAEPSIPGAHQNLKPSTTIGNSYAKLPPDEQKKLILTLLRDVAPGMKMFQGVDIRLIHRLCACVDVIKTQEEVRLIEADSEGHSMFFLLQGQCDVFVTGKRVTKLEAPCTFGEVALLLSERRSADVQTSGPCILCELAQVLSLAYVLACSDIVHFRPLSCHPLFPHSHEHGPGDSTDGFLEYPQRVPFGCKHHNHHPEATGRP
jgi:hypothetical protein